MARISGCEVEVRKEGIEPSAVFIVSGAGAAALCHEFRTHDLDVTLSDKGTFSLGTHQIHAMENQSTAAFLLSQLNAAAQGAEVTVRR